MILPLATVNLMLEHEWNSFYALFRKRLPTWLPGPMAHLLKSIKKHNRDAWMPLPRLFYYNPVTGKQSPVPSFTVTPPPFDQAPILKVYLTTPTPSENRNSQFQFPRSP